MRSSNLVFLDDCRCGGGIACLGHAGHAKPDADWTPIGWQGPTQHTWTRSCDGLHGPGPCPERQPPVTVTAWL